MCYLWYAGASDDYLQAKSSASSSRKTIDSRCRRNKNAPTSEWDTASGKLRNEEDLKRRLPTLTQGQVSESILTAADAFVGFTGKLRLTELNDCMTIQISYDRLTYRALIDSGCDVNILFHDSTPGLTVPTNPLDGTLRGIGDVRAKISGSVRLSVNVGALKMKESTFYILDGENEQYDCILGSEFLRANGFEIHPKENAVKIRDGDGYTLLSFSTSGELPLVLWDIWGDLVFVDLFKSQTPQEGACLDEHLGVERTSSPKQKRLDLRLLDRNESQIESILEIDRYESGELVIDRSTSGELDRQVCWDKWR